MDFKHHIGYVGDFDLAYRDIKLKDIYRFTRNIYGLYWDDSRFKYLMNDLFCINLNQKVGQLSTGMKKKFWLATALSHSPKLLLFDEPTTGIDPDSRDEILEFISGLSKNEGVAVVFSTHIIEDLENTADKVMVVKNGCMEFNDSKTAYFNTRRLKSNDNRVD